VYPDSRGENPKVKRLILVFPLLALGIGCSGHYRVTDPHNGDVYYTTVVSNDFGSKTFRDAKTNNKVTLPAAVVERISEAEFNKAVSEK